MPQVPLRRITVHGMERGQAHAPLPPWRTTHNATEGGHGMLLNFAGMCPPFGRCAVYSEVWGPNYKNQGGLAPDVGGASCLAAVSFSFLGSLIGLGEEAPGSRPVHWPSDRTGTDKGWYSKA